MAKQSIEFDVKFKGFKFSDEFLLRGTFKSGLKWTKIKFHHSINIVYFHRINTSERKIKFHFKLVMRPDVGEMSFDGECLLVSPEQNKIEFIMKNAPRVLGRLVDMFILKNSYLHAEIFAKQENFLFPPAKELLKRLKLNYK